MPKLNVEAEQLIWRHHICTKRNCIKIWRHQIPDVGIALMLSWLQCVQWIGGQSKMDWDLSGNRRTLKSKVKSYKEQARTRATCREISERKEHTWWWLLCRNSPRWEFRPSHWQQEHSGLRPCPALTHTYTLVWQTETHVANTHKRTHIHTCVANRDTCGKYTQTHTHTHSCGKQRHVWQIHTNTLLWQTHKSTQNKHLLVEVRFEESPLEKILSINYEIYSEFSTSSYLTYTQQNHMSKVPRHIRIFWFASCQSQSGPWTHDDFAFCAPPSVTLSSFTEVQK